MPLLAPTGSVITLLPSTTTVSLNSEVDIVATVIENGQARQVGIRHGAGRDDANRERDAGAERYAHNLYDDDRAH